MYLDPGTGSMLIQVLAAAIPVLAAVLFSFRNKIRVLFGKPPVESKTQKDAPTGIEEMKNDDFEKI